MFTTRWISRICSILFVSASLLALTCSALGITSAQAQVQKAARSQTSATPHPPVHEDPPNPGRGVKGSSARAFSLGAAGTNFRYVQTFGVTEEAYPSDTRYLNGPNGMFIDGSDNLYVVEEQGHRLLKYRLSDDANLLSIGKAGFRNADTSTFDSPKDVTIDSGGHIWVVDDPRVVEFDAAGNFMQQFPATDPWANNNDNSHFNGPRGIVFDSTGRMYISDRQNQRVQVYDMSGPAPVYSATIGVTGESGSDNAHFNLPTQIAIDGSDRLYVLDMNNYRVQRCSYVVDTWSCETFFGETGVPGNDLQHLAEGWSNGLVVHGSDLFIADSLNNRVLKCDLAGTCSLFAGASDGSSGTDYSHFSLSEDVAVDTLGNVYVADYTNDRILKFTSSGGTAVGMIGTTLTPYVPDTSRYNQPAGIGLGSDGSIYFTEGHGFRLVKLNAAGDPQWTAGQAGVNGSDTAHFNGQWDGLVGNVAVDSAARVYVPDTGNDRIQIYNASSGAFITSWGSSGSGPSQFSCPWGVAISPLNGDFYVVDRCNNRIQVFNSARVFKTQLGTGVYGSDNTQFAGPSGVAVGANGAIYVADSDNNRVQKCTLSGSSYTCGLFAGVSGEAGEDFSHLFGPYSVAVDASGRVYVADAWNQRVQVFDSTGAYLTTLGGAWGANPSQFRDPKGVALDSQGNVYVTDSRNNRIQKFAPGVTAWQQMNNNGFGDRNNFMVNRMSVLNGYLYAGTGNYATGGEVWRSANGTAWDQVSLDGFGNAANANAEIGEIFNGNLYVGTANAATGGEIWRCAVCDGTDWTQVVSGGLGDGSNESVERIMVFSNALYATTINYNEGVEVWTSPSGDAGSWTRASTGGFGDAKNTGLWAAAVFNGYLYASTAQWGAPWSEDTHTGAEVWRTSDGSAWTQVNADGFGDRNNMSAWLEPFGGYLYGMTNNYGTGTQLWRCASCDGSDWSEVVSDGFGNLDNMGGNFMLGFGGDFYAATINNATGTQVWKTSDGTSWSQVNIDGFGDSNNSSINDGAVFNGSLFFGTYNPANGGEIWRQNEYTLTVSSAHGTVTRNPNKATYHEGDVVQLTATPSAGWKFVSWTGGLTGSTNPVPVTMHANTTITANYRQLVSVTLKSVGTQDGWVLESGENSNKGGSLDDLAITTRLGDDAGRRQYRTILSFGTGANLPDTAVITAVTLKIQKQTITGGGNPVTLFQGFLLDIKNGLFGTTALQTTDFEKAANLTLGPFTPTPLSNWYSFDLTGAKAYINKLANASGTTQIRLRFKLDDNNNAVANYLSLFSGNAAAASRPQLLITYYLP